MTTKLPTPEQANDLFERIYAERFFAKAAQLGIPTPASAREQQAMLQSAYTLDLLPDQSKEASAGDDFHLRANQKLAQLLQQSGCNVDPQAVTKQAAAREHHELVMGVITNPEVYKAAMVLNSALMQDREDQDINNGDQ